MTGHCNGHRRYTKGCNSCQQVTRDYQQSRNRVRPTSTRPEPVLWDQRDRDGWNRMNAIGRRLCGAA